MSDRTGTNSPPVHSPSPSVDERSTLLRQATGSGGRQGRPPYLRQLGYLDDYTRDSSPHSVVLTQQAQLEIPERGMARPDGKSYWAYYIPAMSWIPKYEWSFLPSDLIAGLTLASFQIPVSMSYANLAYVPVVSGLYGLVIPPLVYALLGSVPQMIVGPEAPISMVVSQAMGPYLHPGTPSHGRNLDLNPAQVSGIIGGAAGAVLLLGGLLRVGFIDSVLSKALLRGFISAVGLVMVIDQLPSQLGIDKIMHEVLAEHPTTLGKIKFLFQHAHEYDPLAAQMAFSALAAIMAVRIAKRRYSKKYRALHFVPEILIVVIASALICDYFDLDLYGLEVVGDVKPESVQIELPFTPAKWNDFKSNFSAAFFAAVLGFFESIIAAKSLGSRFDVNVSTNRELVALGCVNLASSLFCALPSFGGYARSKVNAVSGAKTQMSSVVLALATLFSIFFAMPLFFYLPKCVLSSVITVVGLSLLEEAPEDVRFYWRIRGIQDLFTLGITLVSTIVWSVQTGIAVGVLFSLIRVIHHATRPRIQILGRVPGTNIFRNADELPENLEAVAGCLIVKIPEPLTFANTGDLRNRLHRLEFYGSMKVHPGYPRLLDEQYCHHLILDLRGMTECDASAIQILHELVGNYIRRKIVVMFVRMPERRSIRRRFEQSGIDAMVLNQEANQNGQAYFDSIHEALVYVDNHV